MYVYVMLRILYLVAFDTEYYVSVQRHVRCSGAIVFFFQAEDGIRDLVRSRGLGDVYKRQEEMMSGKIFWIYYMNFRIQLCNFYSSPKLLYEKLSLIHI